MRSREASGTTVSRLTPMEPSLPVAERPRRPEWMKVRAPSADTRYFDVKKLIHGERLHTICEEARCPNIAECWGRGTATFQILGATCTRACRYCYVHSGRPDSHPIRSSHSDSRTRRRRWSSSMSSSPLSTATTSPTAAPATTRRRSAR